MYDMINRSIMNKKCFFVLFFLLTAIGCQKVTPPVVDTNSGYTLMYMAADNNNLGNYILDNLKQLEVGFPSNKVGSIYAFIDIYDSKNKETRGFLYEIRSSKNGYADNKLDSKRLKDYGSINSADSKTIDLVISDMAKLYPNKTLKNFSFSSHGSSWIPRGKSIYFSRVSRSIGTDGTSHYEMNIDELASVLEKYDIDVLMFDACHMSSIEVYYQLRNSAKRITASPAEILATGYPYKSLSPHFAGVNLSPEFITGEYFDFYAKNNPYEWGGTISYVVTSELENFAKLTKELLVKYNYIHNTPKMFRRLPSYASRNSEFYDDLHAMFDNLDMSVEDNAKLDNAWRKTFPRYYKTGDSMLSGSVNLKDTYGVCFYAPSKLLPSGYNNYYKSLDWAKDSGLDELLF